MVTGALKKNKKNRKSNRYDLTSRVKILSGENINFKKINSMLNTGCLIILDDIKNRKGLVYRASVKNKLAYVAFKPTPGYFEDARLYFGPGNSYEVLSESCIKLTQEFHPYYKELNEKINRIL